MARNQYHVVPAGDDWKVEKGSQVLGTYDTKDDAVEQGRQVAKNNTPSQLILHTGDGRIETEYTYGEDPYPPAG